MTTSLTHQFFRIQVLCKEPSRNKKILLWTEWNWKNHPAFSRPLNKRHTESMASSLSKPRTAARSCEPHPSFLCAHFDAQLKASNPQFDFQELSKALGLQANCFMCFFSFASDYIYTLIHRCSGEIWVKPRRTSINRKLSNRNNLIIDINGLFRDKYFQELNKNPIQQSTGVLLQQFQQLWDFWELHWK